MRLEWSKHLTHDCEIRLSSSSTNPYQSPLAPLENSAPMMQPAAARQRAAVDFRKSLHFSAFVQVLSVPYASLIGDGGFIFYVLLASTLIYWIGAAWIAFRNRTHMLTVEVELTRYGYFLAIAGVLGGLMMFSRIPGL